MDYYFLPSFWRCTPFSPFSVTSSSLYKSKSVKMLQEHFPDLERGNSLLLWSSMELWIYANTRHVIAYAFNNFICLLKISYCAPAMCQTMLQLQTVKQTGSECSHIKFTHQWEKDIATVENSVKNKDIQELIRKLKKLYLCWDMKDE